MKTLILTCSRNDTYCGGYVAGLMAAMHSPHFAGWCHLDHESDIARGRSKLLDRVLAQTDAPAFLWIDDDIAFTADDFDTICDCDQDIIGGLYPLRSATRRPCHGRLLDPAARGPIVTVDAIGTGFLRMTRRALECMRPLMQKTADLPTEGPGWTHWFPAGLRDGRYLSEDWAFCYLAWQAGIPVHAHRGIRLKHIGIHDYTLPPLGNGRWRADEAGDLTPVP
jgi:hypothetical protein